jgi:hypothetical protein
MTQTNSAPLFGEIVNAVTALRDMRSCLVSLRDTKIVVISAYLKFSALKELLAPLDFSNEVRILTRWQPNDLLAAASDLESYFLASQAGWVFCTRQDLHAKVFGLGTEAIFIGSANLTSNGFSLHGSGNSELMVKVKATAENLGQINSLFDGAVPMNDVLVAGIKAWLDAQPPQANHPSASTWPPSLRPMMEPIFPVTHLMISECFFTDGSAAHTNIVGPGQDALAHDFSLLALPIVEGITIDRALLISTFMRSKMLRWLRTKLAEEDGRECYYGRASTLLHDALLDDHRPERQDVKDLLSNLLGWIELSPECGVVVDRPRFSQRIRLAV